MTVVYSVKLPNLDPWIKQLSSNKNEEESIIPSKFENHLLSIRDERQKMIHCII
jgi:hypothetical protein